MHIIKKLFKNKGFTLIELIVVIAIIAVLSITAGIMLTKWVGKAKDTRTIADIHNIEKAMEINYVEKGNYPMPDNPTTISGDEQEVLWYQGKLGETAVGNIEELTKIPEDSKAGSGLYTYSVTSDQKKFQIGSVITEDETAYNPYVNEVYTNSYKSIVKGTYNDKFIIKGDGADKKIYPAPSIIIDDTTKYATGPLSGQVNFITDKSENYIKEYEDKTGGSKGTNYISWKVGSGTEKQITNALTGAYENFQESGYEEVATMTEDEVITEVEKTEGTYTPIPKTNASCGTANKSYENTATGFGSDTFCNEGTLDGTEPTFPSQGNSVNWTCLSPDAGEDVSCSATYLNPDEETVNCTGKPANSKYYNGNETHSVTIPFGDPAPTANYATTPTQDSCDYSCDSGYSNDGSGNCVDSQAPTGGSVSINGGDASTNSTTVTLNITCASDNVDSTVQVAYGNSTNPTNWTSCTSSISHTLTSGDGTKTVYVRFKDSAGNISSEVSDSIEYNESTTIQPGNTTVIIEREGFKARCGSWEGDICINPQIKIPSGEGPDTCSDFVGLSSNWYSLSFCGTTFNGGSYENYTAEWFCYVATGSPYHNSWGDTGVPINDIYSFTHRYATSYACNTGRTAFNSGISGYTHSDSNYVQVGYCNSSTIGKVKCQW